MAKRTAKTQKSQEFRAANESARKIIGDTVAFAYQDALADRMAYNEPLCGDAMSHWLVTPEIPDKEIEETAQVSAEAMFGEVFSNEKKKIREMFSDVIAGLQEDDSPLKIGRDFPISLTDKEENDILDAILSDLMEQK